MSVEIQWTDTDPETGEKRFVRVERFAQRWNFFVRFRRRENWTKPRQITLEMWEQLLDGLERRYTRREGVSEADLQAVKRTIQHYKPPPSLDVEELSQQDYQIES